MLRCLERITHEIIDIFWINPCGTNTHLNLRCVQLPRLYLRKSLHIWSIFRMIFRISGCYGKFLTHIAAEILVCCLPHIRKRILENNTTKFLGKCILISSGKLSHIIKVDFGFLC